MTYHGTTTVYSGLITGACWLETGGNVGLFWNNNDPYITVQEADYGVNVGSLQ